MFSSDLKRKKWRLILLAVLVMVVSVLPGKAFHAWYNKETGGVLCGGKPKILWIAMGTEPYYNNAAGWYNGCSDWLFSEAGYDPEKATELGKAKIRDNIYIFRHNPDTAYEFFSENWNPCGVIRCMNHSGAARCRMQGQKIRQSF